MSAITVHGYLTLTIFLIALFAAAWPLSRLLAAIADEKFSCGSIEKGIYRIAGINPQKHMRWTQYAGALLTFNLIGVIVVYALQRAQIWLPLNPQDFASVSPDSSFNTAISFVSNTNWQGYAGESTMSYLTQMLALGVQNFLSAATGIAVAFALMRGFAFKNSEHIGNVWVDITRSAIYVLLPLSIIYAVFLISQGVIQNFDGYVEISTLQNDSAKQLLAMGPVASQEAIKMLGTNGGGFFNANSAHPFENPTPLTNFVQMLSIFLIPAALCFTFGRIIRDQRQGIAIISVMTVIFVAMAFVALGSEQNGNPLLSKFDNTSIDQNFSPLQSGGNMEGKETRFGIVDSALFATVTTAASCGAVNAMHDSLTPFGGFVPMWLMQLGEVIFGGVGSGFYGMLIFAIQAVFMAGLMIGRTPEYLGKKIESFEMKMVAIAILVTPLLVLGGTAVAVMAEAGRAGILNPGAHGFSEILYALSSAANNNGSAFAGLSANTPFYNTLLAIAMWFGRFGIIIPVLAIAGSLAAKKKLEVTSGTLPTHGPLFISLLIGTVLIIGALTYIPALALGPIVEHLQLFPSTAAAIR